MQTRVLLRVRKKGAQAVPALPGEGVARRADRTRHGVYVFARWLALRLVGVQEDVFVGARSAGAHQPSARVQLDAAGGGGGDRAASASC